MITYAEHAPATPLGALVRCYWSITGTAEADRPQLNRVTPDGCLDVVLDLRTGDAVAVGAMLQASVFEHVGAVDLFGVRFVPGAAPIFLDASVRELTDAVVPATDIWQDAHLLAERLRTADANRSRIFDGYLVQRLNARRRDELALRAVGLIERSRGLLTVAALRESFDVSERTLQRAFLNAVGITPKQLLRIMRFRQGAALISAGGGTSLARIALLAGYHDQAHFTRDFSELAGITPAAFARERGLVGFVQDRATEADYIGGRTSEQEPTQ